MSVEGNTHSEVVAAIKVGGSVARLLVVDPDTDAFFKRCRVSPTPEHLTGERITVGCRHDADNRSVSSCLPLDPTKLKVSHTVSFPPSSFKSFRLFDSLTFLSPSAKTRRQRH